MSVFCEVMIPLEVEGEEAGRTLAEGLIPSQDEGDVRIFIAKQSAHLLCVPPAKEKDHLCLQGAQR